MHLVEQNSHQLRHRHGRMGIVELNRNLAGKGAPVSAAGGAKAPDDIRQRTGNQKIFLHETQRLAPARRIVGIEHAGERFRLQGFRYRGDEIALAELLEIEEIGSRG